MPEIKLVYCDVPQLEPMAFTNRYQIVRDMEVRYTIDGAGKKVTMPKGYITDGASIPRVLWSIIGSPYQPRFIGAATYHDWGCDQGFDVAEMSEVFRQMLRIANVGSIKASAMHKAVYAFKTIF